VALITHRELTEYSERMNIFDSRSADRELQRSEFKTQYDIFLSHSYLDAKKIFALKNMIQSLTKLSVYVDWIDDRQLSREDVTPETAAVLRKRIETSKILLYAYSDNATQSRWVQWELGYADGEIKKVAILPISDYSKDSFKGHEFLGLYPYIDKAAFKVRPSQQTLWVNHHDGSAVTLDNW